MPLLNDLHLYTIFVSVAAFSFGISISAFRQCWGDRRKKESPRKYNLAARVRCQPLRRTP